MQTPLLGTAGMARKVEELLNGTRSECQALLDTIGISVEHVEDIRPEEIEDVVDAVAGCYALDDSVSHRILRSRRAEIQGIDIGTSTMPGPIARRLVSIGINPLGVALAAQLELGGVTVLEGPYAGLTVESDPERLRGGQGEICPLLTLEGLMWDSSVNDLHVFGTVIPETRAMQMKGRRIEDVIASRLTDGMDLRIAGVTPRSEIDATAITLEECHYIRLRDVPNLIARMHMDAEAD